MLGKLNKCKKKYNDIMMGFGAFSCFSVKKKKSLDIFLFMFRIYFVDTSLFY